MDVVPSVRFKNGDVVISKDGVTASGEHAYFVGRFPETHQFRFNSYERAFAVAQKIVADEKEGTIWVTGDWENWSIAAR